MGRSSNFIWGLLLGAAAGAVLGILYAPDKGSETRRKIKSKYRDFADDIHDTLEDIRDEYDNIVGNTPDDSSSRASEKTSRRGRSRKTNL